MMNASVLVTEWGGGNGDIKDNLQYTIQQQDLHFTSTTYWDWKQSAQSGCGWSIYACATGPNNLTDSNGLVWPQKLAVISRVIPTAVVGHIDTFSYNGTTQIFAMRAAAPITRELLATGDDIVNTLVYVPAHVTRKPSEVVVGGAAKLDRITKQPDGSWIIEVAILVQEGHELEYTVQLGDETGEALAALPHTLGTVGAESGADSAVPAVAQREKVSAALRSMVGAHRRRGVAN